MAVSELNPALIKIKNGKITQAKNTPHDLVNKIGALITNIKKGLIEVHVGSKDEINFVIDTLNRSILAQRQLYLLFGDNKDNPIKFYSDINPRRATIMIDGNILRDPKFSRAFKAFISILESLSSRYGTAKANFLDLEAPILLEPHRERIPPIIQTDKVLAETLIGTPELFDLHHIKVYRTESDQILIRFESDPLSITIYTGGTMPKSCLTKLAKILKLKIVDHGTILVHDQNRETILNALDALIQSRRKLSTIIIKSSIAHIQLDSKTFTMQIEVLPDFMSRPA